MGRISVSYTHLDVYKRQVLKEWSTRNGFPVWSNSLLEDEDIKSDEILTDVSDASKTVSYTHLDVYKRQGNVDEQSIMLLLENFFIEE